MCVCDHSHTLPNMSKNVRLLDQAKNTKLLNQVVLW